MPTVHMAVIRIPYVKVYVDRFGKVRRYFRKPGRKSTPLPGVPGSAEFMAAYQEALGQSRPTPTSRHGAGTVDALICDYLTSPSLHRSRALFEEPLPSRSRSLPSITWPSDGA
jgi:hypothetical protein